MPVRRAVAAAGNLAALALAALAWAAPALAQEASDEVVKTGTLAGDQYLAGRTVRLSARVNGDVLAAGGRVSVSGDVQGDVMAVGGHVEIAGIVADDVRVAGGQVDLSGTVGDEVVAAGGEVTIHRESTVHGRAMLAGRRVVVAGSVGRDLQAGGEFVEIDGEVGGSAGVAAGEVVIGPRARIAGDLTVRSRTPPRIAEGARIGGQLRRIPVSDGGLGGRVGSALRAVAFQLGILLLAGAWLAFLPRFSLTVARVERTEPAVSVSFGVAVLFGLPVLAVVLALTFVGLPLALAAVSAWGLAALLGYASTALCLGDWLRERVGRGGDRFGPRLAGVAAALAVLRLLEAIPWLGVAVGAGALAFGAGALARAAQLAHVQARGVPPAQP